MEVGSGSSSTSAKFNSNISDRDPLHGLKFGKKIYFQAVGGGGGSGRPPPAPAKKGRSGAVQGGAQPPRCQVEGCKVDLSDAKTYYSRHKVCSTHSKSPMVIVGGIQQRFCQQCSRFHQLHEFDQGKRSCRRRLAGHNERRRKPPQPGALLSARFGALSSSLLETNSRPGSFLMDFSSYSSLSGRDLWPNARTSQRAPNTQPVAKPVQHPWQNHHGTSPESVFVQGSASRGPTTAYIAAGDSSGECYASRALSLLSTQSWDTRNQSSSLGIHGLLRPSGTPPVVRPSGFQGGANDYFSSSPWGFKSGDNNTIPTDLGLRQLSEAAVSQYSSDVGASHQPNGRQSLGHEYSRGYQNMHWSL